MKAIALTRYLPVDDPASLLDVELPMPEVGEHDLLVRVEAVSVNPVDTKLRSPKPQVEAQPKVLGFDAAGVVEALGANVEGFQRGDRVYYAGDVSRSAVMRTTRRSTHDWSGMHRSRWSWATRRRCR